jgi:hypothetical protein
MVPPVSWTRPQAQRSLPESALGPFSDLGPRQSEVRSSLNNGHAAACPFRACHEETSQTWLGIKTAPTGAAFRRPRDKPANRLGICVARKPLRLANANGLAVGASKIRLKKRCQRQSTADWLFVFLGVGGWSGLALNSVGWLYQCANQ